MENTSYNLKTSNVVIVYQFTNTNRKYSSFNPTVIGGDMTRQTPLDIIRSLSCSMNDDDCVQLIDLVAAVNSERTYNI